MTVKTEPVSGVDRAERLAAIGMSHIPGIGSTYGKRLVQEAGSFRRIFDLNEEAFERAGVPVTYLGRLRAQKAAALGRAEENLERAEAAGQRVVVLTDPAYPKLLAEIPDPPAALYIYGEADPSDELSLGVVGTRKATPWGLKLAKEISSELASAGITIVSGLALGVDASSHVGALEADVGRTWAVMGCGADVVYPTRNRDIYDRILKGGRGCVVSEFPPGTAPERPYFPMRNRIISGLSLGVLVVEAPDRSGALITAHQAVEQGREVFAVPHPARAVSGTGSNRLIREGAHLVEKAEDILSIIEHQARQIRSRPLVRPAPAPASAEPARPAGTESPLYVLIEGGIQGLDDLVVRSGEKISSVLAELTRLEISGRIRRVAAGAYRAVGRRK